MKGACGLAIAALLMTGCDDQQEKRYRPVFVDAIVEEEDSVPQMDLEEIQQAGTIIAGTLSGPETYYEYRGLQFGLQFKLAQEFAQSIGVKLRMEIAPDTAALLAKLDKGDIDFIALEMPRWQTRISSPNLQSEIYKWWKPQRRKQMLEAIEKENEVRKVKVVRRLRPAMSDRERGVICEYDYLFLRHSTKANMDWRLLAAICYQESGFDPNARSWAGAQGLMQLMPATARSWGVMGADVFNPERNVEAGAQQLGKLQRDFADVPDDQERIKFALGSYNGGQGHVRDAMALTEKYGGNKHLWDDVSKYVLRLADPLYYRDPVVKYGYMRGSETENYVRQIWQLWQEYRGATRSTPAASLPNMYHGDSTRTSIVKTPEEMFRDSLSE